MDGVEYSIPGAEKGSWTIRNCAVQSAKLIKTS